MKTLVLAILTFGMMMGLVVEPSEAVEKFAVPAMKMCGK
jgi:H+/gluconate symporter-like permease